MPLFSPSWVPRLLCLGLWHTHNSCSTYHAWHSLCERGTVMGKWTQSCSCADKTLVGKQGLSTSTWVSALVIQKCIPRSFAVIWIPLLGSWGRQEWAKRQEIPGEPHHCLPLVPLGKGASYWWQSWVERMHERWAWCAEQKLWAKKLNSGNWKQNCSKRQKRSTLPVSPNVNLHQASDMAILFILENENWNSS
jgi:hypothetical protein